MSQPILLYGDSDTAKTTQIGLFARYQWNRTGRPTRLITCDSGFGPVQREVDEGYIIPLCVETAPHPIPVLTKVSKGLWPVEPIDAKRGLWKMGESSKWMAIDEMESERPGGYAIEGVTRICELARNTLLQENRSIGEPLQGLYEQMGEKFAFQSRGTIGAVQTILSNLVTNFRGRKAERVLWTGHEGRGVDERKLTAFGPATIGTAQTAKIAGWFEVALHHDVFMYAAPTKTNPKRQRRGIRAWFEQHPDVEVPKIFWPAKIGVGPGIMAALLRQYPDGYIQMLMDENGNYVQGLDTLLYMIDNNGQYPSTLPTQAEEVVGEDVTEEIDIAAVLRVALEETPQVVTGESATGEPAKELEAGPVQEAKRRGKK